jgi:hypothetical protein
MGVYIGLKRLSHEMDLDLAFEDMYGYWVVSSMPKKGTGHFFNFF